MYTLAEFERKHAVNDPFLKQGMDKPRLVVLGKRMSWAKLLADNRVTALPASKAELDNLRSILARSLKDVTSQGLSADHRFVMAYDAARMLPRAFAFEGSR